MHELLLSNGNLFFRENIIHIDQYSKPRERIPSVTKGMPCYSFTFAIHLEISEGNLCEVQQPRQSSGSDQTAWT